MKSEKKKMNRSGRPDERRRKTDRRNQKRRAHPRVALVPRPVDRRREERRGTKGS